MARYVSILATVAMLSLGGQALGQDVWLLQGQGSKDIVRMNLDGTGLTTVYTRPELRTALQTLIPAAAAADFLRLHVDAAGGKLYSIILYEIPDGGSQYNALIRLDMDGSNIEILQDSGVAQNYILDVQVVRQSTVPAVSTWGLIVMAMLMLSAGTLVMTRRKSVAV